MSRPLTVSLVLPVHRTGKDVHRCLEAIAALDPAPAEVVIVVDGGDPDVVALTRPYATRVLPLPFRGGPARARNAGAATATGDLLLFVDADVVVPADIAARVSDYLGQHVEVDAVIGSYDDQPGAPNFLSQYKNLLNHYTHQRSRTEGYTFWGACGAIRRAAFEALGGFDESFTEPCVEDIELGYRLRAAGGRVHVVKDLQVKHLKRWDAAPMIRSDVLARAVPWSELVLRSGRFDDDLNIDRSGRAKVALTAALLLGLAAARRPAGRAAALASAAALLALDAPLLAFYTRHRGARFAAATVPWIWLSYAYSGAAFGYALARHLRTRRGRRHHHEQ